MNEYGIITTKEEVEKFDLQDYRLLLGEGEFIGTLDHKHWGEKVNLICYFTTSEGEKVKLIVYRDVNEKYMLYKGNVDFRDAELGTKWKCTYGITKNGKSKWKTAELVH